MYWLSLWIHNSPFHLHKHFASIFLKKKDSFCFFYFYRQQTYSYLKLFWEHIYGRRERWRQRRGACHWTTRTMIPFNIHWGYHFPLQYPEPWTQMKIMIDIFFSCRVTGKPKTVWVFSFVTLNSRKEYGKESERQTKAMMDHVWTAWPRRGSFLSQRLVSREALC